MFGDDGRADSLVLPDHVLFGPTVEETLAKMKDFLREWIEAGGSPEQTEYRVRQVSISLVGPFPEEHCVADDTTFDQRLTEVNSPEERFCLLGDAAKLRFDAGDFEGARHYVAELQELLPNFEDHFSYQHASEAVHVVLGRLALQDGNVEDAKRHLLESARGDESPTMSSFGPNMSLARDLLVAGEKRAVLDYFEACRAFWESGSDDLDVWAMYVNAGRIPDFGANLVY